MPEVVTITPYIESVVFVIGEGVVASSDSSKCSVTYLDDGETTVGTAAARSVTGLLNVTTTGCATPTTRRFSALSLNPWMGR